MTRVLIIAGIRLYRDGLALILSQRTGLDIIAAANHPEAIQCVTDLRPDIVLLDLATEESMDILQDLKGLVPALPIVGLAVPAGDADVVLCMEAGLAGYVSREGSVDDLVIAVERAARGELDCSPKVAGLMLRRLTALSAAKASLSAAPRLTNREREIVRLLKQNLSNKEIAVRLGIEVATAKNHVHNLLEKLNIHRRSDVTRLNHS